MNTAQTALIETLTALGYSAKWWAPTGKTLDEAGRVYFNLRRRDAKVYMTFDDASTCEGSSLKVYIDDCGQKPAWYAAQRQQLMDLHMLASYAAVVAGGPSEHPLYVEALAAIEKATAESNA